MQDHYIADFATAIAEIDSCGHRRADYNPRWRMRSVIRKGTEAIL